jgi:hypothetical protein
VVLTPQPHVLALAGLALLAAMWAWGRRIGADPVGVWLMLAGVLTGAVLLLNTRRLRAIGPLVFAATLLLLFGLGAGLAYATLSVWEASGPRRFVREALAPRLERCGCSACSASSAARSGCWRPWGSGGAPGVRSG